MSEIIFLFSIINRKSLLAWQQSKPSNYDWSAFCIFPLIFQQFIFTDELKVFSLVSLVAVTQIFRLSVRLKLSGYVSPKCLGFLPVSRHMLVKWKYHFTKCIILSLTLTENIKLLTRSLFIQSNFIRLLIPYLFSLNVLSGLCTCT